MYFSPEREVLTSEQLLHKAVLKFMELNVSKSKWFSSHFILLNISVRI